MAVSAVQRAPWPERFAHSPVTLPLTFAMALLVLLIVGEAREALTNDFLVLYRGASLARDGRVGDIYNRPVLSHHQRELVPGSNANVNARPPWYQVAIAPLSILPYGAPAYATWIALQVGLLGLAWRWGARRFAAKAVNYACWYLPPMVGIAYGQDDVVLLVLLIAAYVMATRKRHFLSGLLLGAGLFKFHLFLLWPPLLIINKRWTMLLGLAASAVLETLISLWAVGPDGVMQYARFLYSTAAIINQAPVKMISLRGILANLRVDSPAVGFACVAICAALLVLLSFRIDTDQLFIRATVASVFLAPHVYMYSGTILLLPIWLLMFRGFNDRVRTVARWFVTPWAFLILWLAPPPWTIVGSLAVAALFAATLYARGAVKVGDAEICPGHHGLDGTEAL